MKALSIKQPWAYLIAAGIKDVENRTWKTNYRGEFLIHAPISKYYGEDIFSYNQRMAIYKSKEYNNTVKNKKYFNNLMIYSAIIGEVEIIDCIRDSKSIWAEPGCWHWVLKNAVLYDKLITGVKGKLSFWEYKENK